MPGKFMYIGWFTKDKYDGGYVRVWADGECEMGRRKELNNHNAYTKLYADGVTVKQTYNHELITKSNWSLTHAGAENLKYNLGSVPKH